MTSTPAAPVPASRPGPAFRPGPVLDSIATGSDTLKLAIIKCHGSGNGFVLCDGRDVALSEQQWAGVARAVADRAGAIGSDGLLVLNAGDAVHAFAMVMRNSDGSESEQCLNGLRCVARLGFEQLRLSRASVRLKTSSAAVARADPLADGVYTVRETAGPAELDAAAWLKDGGHEHVERPIAGLPSERRFVAVGIGNPHLITFVDAVDEAELVELGRFAESAPPLLPMRANVSFVEARAPDTLFVRTFERGVGLTDSCGSAMAAATFAACLTGRSEFGAAVTVLNRGGRISACAESDGMITILGNATFEWEGSVEIDLVRERAGNVVVTRHHNDEIAAWAKVADA